MRSKKQIVLVIASVIVFCNFLSCKKEPSKEPTVPSTYSIEDGAVISDTIINLSASGSKVEDEGLRISYKYYIGKSPDSMKFLKYHEQVKLTPFTQYFWYVTTETDFHVTSSPIRTFYCVPEAKLSLTTDNGEGESAIVIKWKEDKMYTNLRLSVTSDSSSFKCKNINIKLEPGQTEYTILQGNDYDAYSQDWDDKNGLYYEPIKYNIKITADVQVGDMIQETFQETKEIFLDKTKQVRDEQFNVYRVKKIGNRVWMVDDLRYREAYFSEKLANGAEEKLLITSEVALKSGQKGCLYTIYGFYGYHIATINKILPKGFVLPDVDDWNDLLKTYGAKSLDSWIIRNGYSNYTRKMAQNYETINNPEYESLKKSYYEMLEDTVGYKDQGIGPKLRSKYGWYSALDGKEIIGEGSDFNAKPFGINFDDENVSINSAAFYMTYKLGEHPHYVCIWTGNDGIYKWTDVVTYFGCPTSCMFCSVRGVKMEE